MSSKRSSVKIWTDGSTFEGNPSEKGGWGAIIEYEGNPFKYRVNGLIDENTTNNRAETIAVIESIRRLISPSKILIITDSQYVVLGLKKIGEGLMPKANKDLWRILNRVIHEGKHLVNYRHVRGHQGVDLNEEADDLADKGARGEITDDRFFV